MRWFVAEGRLRLAIQPYPDVIGVRAVTRRRPRRGMNRSAIQPEGKRGDGKSVFEIMDKATRCDLRGCEAFRQCSDPRAGDTCTLQDRFPVSGGSVGQFILYFAGEFVSVTFPLTARGKPLIDKPVLAAKSFGEVSEMALLIDPERHDAIRTWKASGAG